MLISGDPYVAVEVQIRLYVGDKIIAFARAEQPVLLYDALDLELKFVFLATFSAFDKRTTITRWEVVAWSPIKEDIIHVEVGEETFEPGIEYELVYFMVPNRIKL